MIKTTEDLVRIIRICGESIVSNAESIAGDFKYQTACDINIRIPFDTGLPEIDVSNSFLPDGINSVPGVYSSMKGAG